MLGRQADDVWGLVFLVVAVLGALGIYFDLLGPAGTAVLIGLHEDETPLPWHRVIRSNLRLQGVFGYADADFQQALDWLAAGRAAIPLSDVRPLAAGPEAFRALAAGPIEEIKIFLA